jgi:plastocyanin
MKTFKNYFKQILLLTTIVLFASCSSSDSDPIDEIPDVSVINYDVTNNGGSAYVFNNAKFTDSENPELTLERGKTYTFTVNSPGHPFLIKLINSTGTNNMYNIGVVNNGTANGIVTFTVPSTAPNTLYYNCEFHAAMAGKILIIGGTPETIINYDVTNTGGSAYVFNNANFTNSENPNITLERGKTYTFTVNAPGHPFLIKSIQNTGVDNLYSGGVQNNGSVSGVLTFTVPFTAPDKLYYNCEFHAAMTGEITIL